MQFPQSIRWPLWCGAVLAGMAAQAATPPSGAETVTYALEDFETGTLPGLWCGRPEAGGAKALETKTVHGGKAALAMSWDFSKSPGADNCFVNFTFGRELAGRPQALNFWLYADAASQGTPISLWIMDASGETYISRATVDWTGWKQVTLPVAASPAFLSGDKNNRLDLPASLFGVAVDFGGPKTGRLVVDDLAVVTVVTPREALLPVIATDRPHNLFWQDQPVLSVGVRNVSRTPVAGLHVDLKVVDTYYNRPIFQERVALATVPGQGRTDQAVTFRAPYGVHRIEWRLGDAQGIIKQGVAEFSRMLPKCYQKASPAEQAYLRQTSPFGGVFWQATPEQGSDTGARWIRNFGDDWRGMEPRAGVYDLTRAVAAVEQFRKAGIESLWLTCLYSQPEFRQLNQPDFAPAMGTLHQRLAEALKERVFWYEIGNEDNGPSKFLYTEVGRHAAAGVHAADPFAQIANSGTAYCDVNWLKMQADRGLFHWLDALCVHPYTASDSPEKWGVYEQAQGVVALADQLGGMKALWTTEFGWPAEVPALDRADWTPRHFMIGVAAGYDKHGLYAWDGHFGIYDNGRPFLSAVSTQAMAKFVEGARFAGILERTPERWAVVWEKFGEPVLAAWTVTGSQSWSVPVGSGKVRVYDLFGNEQPARVANGMLTLELSTGPHYVTGASPTLTSTAWTNQLAWLRARTEIPANRLRIALLEARMGRPPAAGASQPAADPAAFPRLAAAAMKKAQAADLDLPGLRWAAQEFKNLELERRFAEAQGRRTFAKRLTTAQALLADYAERELLPDAARRFTAVWPYLYTLDADGKTLVERLQFVPGNPREVKMRVNNYARHAYAAEVSLRLPPNWRSQPAVRTIRLTPGQAAETTFQVTCPNGKAEAPVLTARVAIPGQPVVDVAYDQVEIAPAVKIVQEPLEALLPAAPLRLELRNLDRQTQSGRVRLLLNGQTTAAARADFNGLAPKAKKTMDLPLTAGPAPAFNEWPLTAEVTLADGRSGRQPVTVDFACAVRAVTPPVIDGDLTDWRDAAPLHLDKSEYAKGSFGLNWSPEDCSATTWVKWDDQCLYFAAKVRDQTFNQNMHGESLWIQDSFQLGFARNQDQKTWVELGLALTPQGPEIFRYTPPSGDVAGARLKVVVSQGQAIYEAAIPWAALPELGRVALNDRIRYTVLLNDDDAVVPRRFLERYGGVAHDKNVANFGWLRLIGPAPAPAVAAPTPAAEANRASVFQEDFEEYPDLCEPDTWQRQTDQPPVPTGAVTAGAGRRGSKALLLHNTIGLRPHCYLIYVRELTGLEPGARYHLRAWVNGKGIPDPSGIIGLCSDRWGNESFAYAGGWKADGQWHEVMLPFTAPAGTYHVILRNATAIERLAIDDLAVERLP